MFIQTEATPNPATLKFLPGRVVMPEGTFDARDAAGAARLAARRAAVRDRRASPACSSATTSSPSPRRDGEWQHLKPAILGAIMEHFMAGQPILRSGCAARRGGRARSSSRGRRRRPSPPSRSCSRPASARRSRRRRRHHVPRLQGRRRVSRHEGLLLGLPVLDRHPEARHPEPAAPLPPRRARGPVGLKGSASRGPPPGENAAPFRDHALGSDAAREGRVFIRGNVRCQ